MKTLARTLTARTLTALAVGAAALTLTPGAASADDARGEPGVSIHTVLDGRVKGVAGNQHRLSLDTDSGPGRYTHPRHAAKLVSFSCAPGKRITFERAPKGCVRTGTTYLTMGPEDYRVSPGTRTAKVNGWITGGGRRFDAELRMASDRPLLLITDPVSDTVTYSRSTEVTGTFGGATVRPDGGGANSWFYRTFHGDNA